MKKIICMSIIIGMLVLTACGSDVNLYEGLNLSDYLKVGEYKGVKAEKVEVKVEKSEIGDAIVEALKAATKDVELSKGDEVKKGDTVNIDYVGKVDGKTFEGGSAEGQELLLGSGTYISMDSKKDSSDIKSVSRTLSSRLHSLRITTRRNSRGRMLFSQSRSIRLQGLKSLSTMTRS